ncbi:MAG: N-acetylmuramoyl-L-alanine amidase [Treponema sp.]|jgi:N-acetylmuramoyl-L-alanine amidase|nr:N-acetylmuramoyl-L-alanine amidase [Treponema sp.]
MVSPQRGRGLFRFSLYLLLLAGAAGGIFGEEAGVSGGAGGTPPEKTLSLDETLSRLNLSPGGTAELRWDPFFESGVLRIAGRYVAFNAGKPGETGFILVDGRELISVPLPWLDKGLLLFPEPLVGILRGIPEAAAAEEQSRFRITAIIVDPGHGGKDSGAIGNHLINGKPLKVVEKDITLKVSRLLHSRLSAAYPDKRVFLTREGDTYPSLEDRVVIANSVPLRENEAIVFVSIHANASFNRSARGYEVWYLSPDYRRTVIDEKKYADSAEVIPILNAMMEEEFTTESIMIAQSITNRIAESMGKLIPSRGIKAEEWFVVRNARMPSVLVELGFVTNEEDARLMTDDTCLRNLSDALYKGIADFVATFERSGGFTALQ